MSDWSFNELENIACYEFCTSDDHIVPTQGGEQVNEFIGPGDVHKKTWNEVENVGKSADGSRSATRSAFRMKEEASFHSLLNDGISTVLKDSLSHASDSVIQASCDTKFITNASASASQGARNPDEPVNDCNGDTDNIFIQVPIIESMASIDGSRSCHLLIGDILPAVPNNGFCENENKEIENDLMHCHLPDIGIGNFEDIDKTFSFWRNCDTTIGKDHLSTEDDLSWLSSSSDTFYGSEVTLGSGLLSTFLELNELNNISGHHGAYTNIFPKSDQAMANHGKLSNFCYQSHAGWLDTGAEYKGESAPTEQVYDKGDGFQISPLTQINGADVLNGCEDPDMVNMHLRKMETRCSPEEKEMQPYGPYADQEFLSSPIFTQTHSSQDSSRQKHFLGASTSSYTHSFNPYPPLDYSCPTHQVSFPQATSSIKYENATDLSSCRSLDNFINHAPQSMEKLPDEMCEMTPNEKLKKLHDRHELFDTMIPEHMHEKKHRGYEYKIRANSSVETISLEPAIEIDSSRVQESSCMSSVCPDDISLEVTSFRQLQDVMDQFDIRTNLCIRDSLYRLARGAKRRNVFADTNNCSRKSIRGLQGTVAPKKVLLVKKETAQSPSKRKPIHSTRKHHPYSMQYWSTYLEETHLQDEGWLWSHRNFVSNGCAEFMDAETDTNPIDRSIAHLLFTGLLYPASGGLSGDGILRESPANVCFQWNADRAVYL